MFKTLVELKKDYEKNVNCKTCLNDVADEILQYLINEGYPDAEVIVSVNRDYKRPILVITTNLGEDVDILKWFELGSKTVGKILDSGYYAIQMLWSKGLIFECLPTQPTQLTQPTQPQNEPQKQKEQRNQITEDVC